MATEIIRTGGCLCGAIRYTVKGEPYKSGLCHCTDCRQVTGSAFLAYADWQPGQFEYTGLVVTFRGRAFVRFVVRAYSAAMSVRSKFTSVPLMTCPRASNPWTKAGSSDANGGSIRFSMRDNTTRTFRLGADRACLRISDRADGSLDLNCTRAIARYR